MSQLEHEALDLLAQTTELDASHPFYKKLSVFTKFGHPEQKVKVLGNAQSINVNSNVVLPIVDASMKVIQCAVIDAVQGIKYSPNQPMTGFSFFGDLKQDLPIIITYNLEAFFKIAQTKLCVILISPVIHLTKRKLKNVELDTLLSIIDDLTHAGFQKLFLPVYPEEKGLFAKLKEMTSVSLLPLHQHDSNCDLSMYDEVAELTAYLESALTESSTATTKIFSSENGTFYRRKDGVFFNEKMKDKAPKSIFISSPIEVLANTRDETSNNWGILLQWSDQSNTIHKTAIPMELFQTDGTELRKTLANQGLRITPDKKGRDLFQSYLIQYPCDKNILCVNKVGWHNDCYILPHQTFGRSDETIVYQSALGLDNKYKCHGNLEDWRQDVSQCIEKHNLLVFSLCTAFTGQLISPLNQSGCGFHFKGSSSKGKTTALKLAASVWGNPKDFIRSWKATGNALEHTAHMHNDGFIALDEISEIADSRELGNIVYMLANGVGKARMTKHLHSNTLHKWNLIFLSSGEKSVAELMAEQGQKTKLGQQIRLAEIDIDDSLYGIFSDLDFEESSAKQAITLNKNLTKHYGVAGLSWLQYLTDHPLLKIEQATHLFEQYKAIFTDFSHKGHIQRVATYFALIATAGEMATQAGITGWQKGTALRATITTFGQWMENFEQSDNQQSQAILKFMRSWIAENESKFEEISSTNTIKDRIGFYAIEDGKKQFFILNEDFKRMIGTRFKISLVAQTLDELGYLIRDKTRYTKTKRISNISSQTKCTYGIKASILEYQYHLDDNSVFSSSNIENMVNMLVSK